MPDPDRDPATPPVPRDDTPDGRDAPPAPDAAPGSTNPTSVSRPDDSREGVRPSGKVLVLTAPSGAGKTTLVRHLLASLPDELAFSVSATTRPPRHREREGVDYHFLNADEFARRVAAGEFLEFEEVYAGQYYGTLRSEVERQWAGGKTVVFDVEVKGATHLKQILGRAAYVVFVAPPSEEALFARLRARGTEDEASLQRRIARASEELRYRDRFDRVVLNDDLDRAKAEALAVARAWLEA